MFYGCLVWPIYYIYYIHIVRTQQYSVSKTHKKKLQIHHIVVRCQNFSAFAVTMLHKMYVHVVYLLP